MDEKLKVQYLIQNVDEHTFWQHDYRNFRSYLWATKFDSEDILMEYVKRENIGVFKIAKVYDTK